jgi:transglutaminase-like putative cysteine protease
VALYIFLYQLRLIAADLSDTPVFITAILGAFVSAFAISLFSDAGLRASASGGRKRYPPGGKALFNPVTLLTASGGLVLIPVVIRLLIASLRPLGGGDINGKILFDSLLLNYDRNAFVTAAPFYWTACSTFFSLRSRRALRFFAVADCILLIAVFSIAGSASIYSLPLLRIIVFAAIVFFELAALILSSPPEMRPEKKDYAAAICVLLLLASFCGALLVRPLQERALEQGGGLLQPKLFSFDFAPYLRLENEISMNDDLVFIVRKSSRYETAGDTELMDETPETLDVDGGYDPRYYSYAAAYTDDHYLMRRFVLSAYNTKEEKDRTIGFFRNDKIDEEAQGANLPHGRTRYKTPPGASREKLRQEYYLVNIDSSAFIAMNEPVETLPFENWDASSFKSAYAVNSMVNVCTPSELINAVPAEYDAEALGLTEDDYEYYTKFSGSKNNKTEREQKITALAEKITAYTNNYWEKIQYIYQYLKFGDYRYSLKPGIAPSGDQLDYFLFDTKKGYCSYFAFAFASLLRSINIPCRVAVGFFLEPGEGRLDFYPVRSNMAHAWVEVWFPDFGWIEYDPTTKKLAEDEEFEFSAGIPPELFERLMKEIIDNHDRLKVKEAAERDENRENAAAARAAAFIKKSFAYIAVMLVAGAFIVIRFGYYIRSRFSGNPRKKTLRLWRHIKRRLRLAGMPCAEAESEWVNRVMTEEPDSPLRALYDNVSAARYAEYYTADEAKEFFALYETFSLWYKKRFSPLRKFKTHDAAKPLVFIFCIFLFSSNVKTYTQENVTEAEELFSQALTAENSEFWERALELYMRGKMEYPLDYRFPLRLGDLYFNRELYRLAMDEFLIANSLLPDDTQLLYRLAQTAGNLNENKLAAAFLENLLALDPVNHEAIGSLGWMYFKLHRLRDGEKLLSDAIERFGPDVDFYMTLGTIYSDMFNYKEAKRYYLDAVNGAISLGGTEFASVAYYNLSILESRFYRYQDALSSTTSSLLLSNRSSGHLARGELMMRRLDFNEAFSEYNKSYEMDKSQLSKLSLAQAFLASGDLEQARLYAEDGLTSNNLYWMLNYGIDPVQYKRDLHEILYKTYRGFEKREALSAHYGLYGAVYALGLRAACYFKYRVHKLLYQKYALLSAGAFEETELGSGERHLEALFQYYNAFYDYRGRASDYLKAAEDFELRLIPEASPSYLFETGKLTRNIALLNDALPGFDPVWEKDITADTYTEIALIAQKNGRPELAAEAAGRLFALNPGALRQNGISLPVNLEISGEAFGVDGRASAVQKALRQAGFDTKPAGVPRWSLRLHSGEAAGVSAELYDGGTGKTFLRETLTLASFSRKQFCQFANTLADEAFNGYASAR